LCLSGSFNITASSKIISQLSKEDEMDRTGRDHLENLDHMEDNIKVGLK
jgi:hypothetical protein